VHRRLPRVFLLWCNCMAFVRQCSMFKGATDHRTPRGGGGNGSQWRMASRSTGRKRAGEPCLRRGFGAASLPARPASGLFFVRHSGQYSQMQDEGKR
jgi:hypothetical protein